MSDINYGIRISANAQGVADTFKGVGKSAAEASKEAQKAAEDYVKSLKDEAATLGMTSLQVKAYKGDQLQLNEAQKQAATEAITRIRQYQEEQVSLEGIRNTAAAVTRTVGGLASAWVGAMALKVRSSINAAAETATLSEKTGVLAEELSGLRYAADVSDTSINTLARSMQQLPKSLAEATNPNSGPGRAFAFLQIDPAQITSQQDAINKIADAIRRVEDPMAKSAALSLIFKRNGEELIPFFNNGAEGLKRLTDEGRRWAEISGTNATQAKAMKDNLVTLNYSTSELARNIGENLVVAVNNGAEAYLKQAREGNKLLGVIAAINAMFSGNEKQQLERSMAMQTDIMLRAQNDLDRATASGNTRAIELARTRFNAVRDEVIKTKSEIDRLSPPGAAPTGPAIKGGAESLGREGSAGRQVAERISASERMVKSLQDEAATYGMTAEQVKVYRLERTATTEKELIAGSEAIGRIMRMKEEADRLKELAKLEQDRQRLQSQADDAYRKRVEDIGVAAERDQEATEQLRRHNEEIGLTTEQLRVLRIARADETVAKLESAAADAAAEPGRERELQLIERRIAAAKVYAEEVRRGTGKEAEVERRDAMAKAAKDAESEAKRRSQTIERELTGALLRGFEAGKDASRVFMDALVNMAKTVILEPMIKPVIDPIAQAASAASSGLGGWLGDIMGGLFGGGSSVSAASAASSVGSSWTFLANGGVMTPQGPLPLRGYSSGGVANSPQVAVFGEGSQEEAFVPLPDGRRIPVAMQGGGVPQVNAPLQISIDARGADSGVEAKIIQTLHQYLPPMLAKHSKVIEGVVARGSHRLGRRSTFG